LYGNLEEHYEQEPALQGKINVVHFYKQLITIKKHTFHSTKSYITRLSSLLWNTGNDRTHRCCRFLLRKHFFDQVMDDEKYFTFSHSTLSGTDGFWTADVANISEAVQYKAVGKFKPIVLIWCVISEASVSTPFIGTVKGQAVDAGVYISKCLLKW
jgi:hypothetical protein